MTVLPTASFHLPIELDYLAVCAWALSGALVGLRKRFDLVGVFVTALVSAVGGGLLRDGLLLQKIPAVLTQFAYLPLIAATTALAIALARRLAQAKRIETAIDIVDSLGTPAFAVVGVEMGVQAGLPWPGALLVGCVSGVGGGVLRDVLVGQPPEIMQPGRYLAILVAGACALYLTLTLGFGLPRSAAAWGVVAVYFAVRLATIRFDWRTRPILPE